ncbi:MAG: HK97 gp10 family phage protein [Lachnospiraceae bacterium]|nr:HK97 gp10 family phage protein [Lachnospiraceae bacterium]
MNGDTITIQMENLLDGYSKELETAADKVASGVASAAVNKLKKSSPRGKGKKHYADGWKKVRVRKGEYTVHNSTKPGLTHLLNNGHAKSNGSGRTDGDNHIGEVADWAAEEFVRRMEKSV